MVTNSLFRRKTTDDLWEETETHHGTLHFSELSWKKNSHIWTHKKLIYKHICETHLPPSHVKSLSGPDQTLVLLCLITCSVEGAWPAEWSSPGAGMEKRNLVVADDAAFREKSKLLTSMERQKWLNSYMQKLLVVNSWWSRLVHHQTLR